MSRCLNGLLRIVSDTAVIDLMRAYSIQAYSIFLTQRHQGLVQFGRTKRVSVKNSGSRTMQ
jgi:hypothetical protein